MVTIAEITQTLLQHTQYINSFIIKAPIEEVLVTQIMNFENPPYKYNLKQALSHPKIIVCWKINADVCYQIFNTTSSFMSRYYLQEYKNLIELPNAKLLGESVRGYYLTHNSYIILPETKSLLQTWFEQNQGTPNKLSFADIEKSNPIHVYKGLIDPNSSKTQLFHNHYLHSIRNNQIFQYKFPF